MPWGGRQVEVLVQVVSALFDINPSMNTHMAMPLWKRCVGTLLEVRGFHSHSAGFLPAVCTCACLWRVAAAADSSPALASVLCFCCQFSMRFLMCRLFSAHRATDIHRSHIQGFCHLSLRFFIKLPLIHRPTVQWCSRSQALRLALRAGAGAAGGASAHRDGREL